MGIDPEAFRWMTLAELNEASRQWGESQYQQYKERWERERWSTANIINIQLDPKDRATPEKMFPFPWDKKERKKRKAGGRDIKEICEEARRLIEEDCASTPLGDQPSTPLDDRITNPYPS